MDTEAREDFADRAQKLVTSNDEIKILSITVKKEKVLPHIRNDGNKLYNYMIGLSLLNEMKAHSKVVFIPDPRAIKVKSGNSMHDYLQTKLWFDKGAETILNTLPQDSHACKSIQVADMIAGIVQNHFEDGNSNAWKILSPHITHRNLFF